MFIAFSRFGATFINDSCLILGHSRWDVSNFGDGQVYKEILNPSLNNIDDSIIADTAVTNNCILLTNDTELYGKMKNLNYRAMNFQEFEEAIK